MNLYRIDNVHVNLDQVSIVIEQPDGSVVLGVNGGQVRVPLTGRSELLAALKALSGAGALPAMVDVPKTKAADLMTLLPAPDSAPAIGPNSCGRCGAIVPGAPGSDESPPRWLCKCDPR